MAEYIKRSAAIEAAKHAWAKGLEPSQYIEIIPAADVAPVVRCKDCRYWGDADGISTNVDGVRFARCRAHNHYVAGMHIGWCPAEDDFCSCGAREDGDDDAKAD